MVRLGMTVILRQVKQDNIEIYKLTKEIVKNKNNNNNN